MPSTLDRLAAAEMVRQALAGGVDVRTLGDEDYRRVRTAMLRQAGGGSPPNDSPVPGYVASMDHGEYLRAKAALMRQASADEMRARDTRDLEAATRRFAPKMES